MCIQKSWLHTGTFSTFRSMTEGVTSSKLVRQTINSFIPTSHLNNSITYNTQVWISLFWADCEWLVSSGDIEGYDCLNPPANQSEKYTMRIWIVTAYIFSVCWIHCSSTFTHGYLPFHSTQQIWYGYIVCAFIYIYRHILLRALSLWVVTKPKHHFLLAF